MSNLPNPDTAATDCLPKSQPATRRRAFVPLALVLAALAVLGVLVWQAIADNGNPDVTRPGISPTAAVMDTGVLVFREGLEAILVLAALTASLVRTRTDFWKPVALGAGLSFVATLATWFALVALIDHINAPALHVQAATGLVAILVLLVIMNWFFHKVYWSGWICMHERRKRSILQGAAGGGSASLGLALLGLTAVYREGFEVVLFLQSIRLRAGGRLVLTGTCIGLALTAIVGVLTFTAQRRLPYRKMLVVTGLMLGAVLLVMVGESAQELQQAGWLSTTPVSLPLAEWMGMWFALFPNLEGLASQVIAAALVVGSYFAARRWARGRASSLPEAEPAQT